MTEAALIPDEQVRDRGTMDLDKHGIRLADGTRLTEARAGQVENRLECRRRAGSPSGRHANTPPHHTDQERVRTG